MKLWKTTVVIWTDFNPLQLELSRLACKAEYGDAICSKQHVEQVENPAADPDAPDLEFFGEYRNDDDPGIMYLTKVPQNETGSVIRQADAATVSAAATDASKRHAPEPGACPECDGEGTAWGSLCSYCGGTGRD